MTAEVPGGQATAAPKARHIAVLQGILPFDPKSISGEVLAGLTLAALAIPEVMGYATLAGMPVVTGLYTIFLPMLVFGVLGSSRHLVVGADSATAVVMAAGLAGMATSGSDEYIALASMMALLAGALLIIARLIKLGFIADFLSRTVLIGFLTGVGIQVACGQIAGMLGISKGSGVTIGGHTFTSTIATLISTLRNLGDVSWATVAVSAGVLGTILGLKLVTGKVPGALVAVIGAIFISWQWDLSSHGVATLGSLSGGVPPIGLPEVSWSDIPPLAGTAVSILVIILAQSAATSRAYAAKYNDHFDENVDLVGLGAASIAAGLSGTFVVNGSPTKTQMVDGAGGRSQIAQIATALIVLIVLLFLTGPIQYMPTAVLASVVFLIGVELIDIAGMRQVLARRPDEFVVAALVALTVVVAGVEQGIVLGIVASIIDHMRRSYRPVTAVLEPGDRTAWHATDVTPGSRTLPGLVVYRFSGSLYYANANLFLEQAEAFAADPAPLRWICLDATAVPDVDYSGGETIRQLHGALDERGIALVIAAANEPVRASLDRYELAAVLGADAIYDSVEDAVAAFHLSAPLPPHGDPAPTPAP
jgi:sulfate permease, SulP family